MRVSMLIKKNSKLNGVRSEYQINQDNTALTTVN